MKRDPGGSLVARKQKIDPCGFVAAGNRPIGRSSKKPHQKLSPLGGLLLLPVRAARPGPQPEIRTHHEQHPQHQDKAAHGSGSIHSGTRLTVRRFRLVRRPCFCCLQRGHAALRAGRQRAPAGEKPTQPISAKLRRAGRVLRPLHTGRAITAQVSQHDGPCGGVRPAPARLLQSAQSRARPQPRHVGVFTAGFRISRWRCSTCETRRVSTMREPGYGGCARNRAASRRFPRRNRAASRHAYGGGGLRSWSAFEPPSST